MSKKHRTRQLVKVILAERQANKIMARALRDALIANYHTEQKLEIFRQNYTGEPREDQTQDRA